MKLERLHTVKKKGHLAVSWWDEKNEEVLVGISIFFHISRKKTSYVSIAGDFYGRMWSKIFLRKVDGTRS